MKKLLSVLLVILLIIAAGTAWVLMNYHVIDFKFYPKKAQILDLRGENISIQQYEELTQNLVGCEIFWDVPFQGSSYPSDSAVLAMSNPSDEDLKMLSYFPQLETLDARECSTLSWLPSLYETRPGLKVQFNLSLDGNTYSQDAEQIEMNSIPEDALALLPYMTELELVTVTEGGDTSNLEKLSNYCKSNGIEIQIVVNGQTVTETDQNLTISNVTDNQVSLLMLMTQLKTLHLPEPEAKAERLLALVENMPETTVTWEKTVLGMTFAQDATEIDLTDVIARAGGEGPEVKTAYEYGLGFRVAGTQEENPSSAKILPGHPLPNKWEETMTIIAEVEAAMEYFPAAEKLVMCGAYLDNEGMAQFREAHREDYKVVWSVRCGDMATRTDATLFMPTKYHVAMGAFSDLDAYNLRYCEDMVCIDLGHMTITDLEFARYMPNLKYLVITLTYVEDLSPLSACKNLVFLEMDWCDRVMDYSPLVECTALEDLNIGETFGDVTPILEMTWLKNLWLVGCAESSYRKAVEAMPDTNIAYYYGNPDDVWRTLPNYYKMRDALLMYYME